MAQINKPTDYFNTKLYTGTGSSNAVTGVGFQPDLVWIKNRSQAYWHQAFNVVSGASNVLYPNETAAESDASTSFVSFDSDGFTVNTNDGTNGNGENLVAWNWLADNTSGSSNTDGSITSTVSANTTSGFSIVSYTGTGANATVGHGLGAAPKMYICKSRSSVRSWAVYNENIGNTKALFLDTSAAQDTDSTYWNSTSPTNSVVSLGSRSEMNHSGENFVMYCFAEKKGFSKFGKYIGTGSTTGTPFIYTGFKPAFVMTKGADIADQWTMSDIPRDNAVGGGNGTGARLTADSNAAEATNTSWASIQKYSNGFSPQGNDGVTNGSGSTYIYMAFAEEPLVGTNNIPATAR